jgi:hypothetical protein
MYKKSERHFSAGPVDLQPYEMRAWRCWGLCRHRHLLHLKVHVRIPAPKNGAQLPVQRSYSRLQLSLSRLYLLYLLLKII